MGCAGEVRQMNKKIFEEVRGKILTPKKAVEIVCSGDRVFIGITCNVAYDLAEALWERRLELENIKLISSLIINPISLYTEKTETLPFEIITPFLGYWEKAAVKYGRSCNYTSLHLSQLDVWFHKIGKPNVAFLAVSMPDENGNVSFGPSGGSIYPYVLDTADKVIVEIVEDMPYVKGQNAVFPLRKADAVVISQKNISYLQDSEADETTKKISEIIIPEIPDGATIQLGIGSLSSALGNELKNKNDLGIFTEMFCTSMMGLMKSGNVTNKKKGFLDGKSVFAFSVGTKEMYEFMHENEHIYSAPFAFVNDPRTIMKNKFMISINTAMAMNVYGEVAAEAIGYKQQSAVGGQLDFIRGSQWSEGGKSFIAMASSFVKDGRRISKINLNFPKGTPVTTPRSDVQYVVTEFGCVNLKLLTMRERVRAMISLAHPDFRDELMQQAKDANMI